MNRKTTTFALTAAFLALAGTGVSAHAQLLTSQVTAQSAPRLVVKDAPTKQASYINVRISENFSLNSWSANSFKWTPRNNTPQELASQSENTPIVATRGLAQIKEKGAHTFTFGYKSGNNKLIVLGVDACDLAGKVVAKDYHRGETGNNSNKNTYTLEFSEEGVYEIRYFVANTSNEPINSQGEIKTSPEVFKVFVVEDLEANESPRWESNETPSIPEGTTKIDREGGNFPWKPEEWKPVTEMPQDIESISLGGQNLTTANVLRKDVKVYIDGIGQIKVEYLYKSGKMALYSVGADLVDAEGRVVASDYHHGESGNRKRDNVYTFNVLRKGSYTLRFFAENKTRNLDSSGDAKIHSNFMGNIYHLPQGSFYALNFDKDARTSNSHGEYRQLKSITFSPQYGQEMKLNVENPEEGRAFEDFTNEQQRVKVMPGSEVSMKLDYGNNWMHTYLYIDADNNKRFDVNSLSDRELLVCTYLDGQKKTREGVTTSTNQSPDIKDPFIFNAPEQPGTYRMRCKIEWNHLDPGAKSTGKNTIFDNDGKVVDFILEVQDSKDLDNTSLEGTTYNLTVRKGKNGNFATMQVPFAVTLPNHMRAYRLTNPQEGGELHFEALPGDVVPANTPVFLASTQDGTFTCKAAPYQAPLTNTNLYGSLVPVTQAMRDQDSEFKYYALTLDHKTNLWEFRPIRQGATFPANRCFLKLHKSQPASALRFVLPNPGVTGISTATSKANSEDGATFNLAGQRIEAANAKGVVIRNGKKVVLP